MEHYLLPQPASSGEDETDTATTFSLANPSATLDADGTRLGATGIDTLKLFFPLRLLRRPDFHVLQRRAKRGRDVGEGVLWRDPQGHTAFGALAVRRCGPFRFRIAPVGCEIKLRAFFSVPHAAFGHNARAVTRHELMGVLQEMQEVLRDLGLDVDWHEGQVSRADVHRDVALRRPFHFYLPALHLIEPRYGRLWQNYPSGVLRGAATRLVYSLYDKRVERQHRKLPQPQETEQLPGWLRCEARLPAAAAVRQQLHLDNAGELVEKFEALASWLDERIECDLLGEEVPDYVSHPQTMSFPTYTPDDDVWWRARLGGEGESFKDRLALLGMQVAVATLGPQKFWELAKEECCDDGLQPSKLRGHFRQIALASFSDQMLPVAQLYHELKNALLWN